MLASRSSLVLAGRRWARPPSTPPATAPERTRRPRMSADQKMPPRTETARGFLSRFGAAIPHLLQPHTDADATTVIHVTTFASNPTAGRASTDGSVAGLLDVERARAELDDALLRVHATLGQ